MELPAELIEVVVERGQILHSDIFENIDHPKFFVVIGVTDTHIAGFFYINSSINTLVNRKPEQLALQYPLRKQDYAFLDHDSYICATNVVQIDKYRLVDSIQSGRTTPVAQLKVEHIAELLEKVRTSRLFSSFVKKTFFY